MSRVMSGRTAALAIATVVLVLFFSGCRNVLIERLDQSIEEVVTPPAVSAIFPSSQSTDVPINTEVISISFEKQIDASTVNAGSFYVAVLNDDGSRGGTVSGSRSVSSDTITFSPNADLDYDTTYIVVATRDIRDVDENALTEEYTWTFTTGLAPDTTAPIGSALTINGGDAWTTSRTVTLTIDATDDRAIAQMNISNVNSFSDANWTTFADEYEWTIPEGNGTHTVYIKFQDGAGNQSSTINGSIQLDSSLPTIEVFALDGGRSATSNTEISVGISAIDSAGSSGVVEYQTRLAGEDWPATWTGLTITAIEGEADQGTALETGVSFPAGTVSDDEITYEARVRDLAGNVSIVAESSIVYDLSQPTVDPTIANPSSGQTGVTYDASVVTVYFNEEMNVATFTPDTFFVADAGGNPLNGGDFDYEFDAYEGTPFRQVRLVGLELNPNSDYFVTVGGSVEDVAGNTIGSDETWFFQTGNATDTTAPGAEVIAYVSGTNINAPGSTDDLPVLPDGRFATNENLVVLDVNASDDYNSVYGINIWGEGSAATVGGSNISLDPFEDPVGGWVAYDDEVEWTFGAADGEYNLWYRLQDSRGNKSPDPPGFFSVVRDSAAPTVSSVDITNAQDDVVNDLHVNDPDGLIDLVFSAGDGTGSGMYRYRVSNDPDGGGGGQFDDRLYDPDGPASGDSGYGSSETTSEPNAWRPWSPLLNDWEIEPGVENPVEGSRTLYFEFQDYLENTTAATVQYFYDVTPPVVGSLDILETNMEATLTGTFSDNVTGFSSLSINDLTYQWEQVDGPGEISFVDTDPAPGVDTSSYRQPTVSADTDGTYLLRVTVTDPAGNASSSTVQFKWDATPPDDMGSLATDSYYSATDEPVITWDAVPGADYYRVQIDDSDADDTDDIDTTTTQLSYTPPVETLEEGSIDVVVTPYDNAGNSGAANPDSDDFVFIDTIAPAIADDGQVFLENQAFTATYTAVSGGALDSGEVLESGSGIASYLWVRTSGAGTVTFGSSDAISTTVSADTHGYYGIAFTVTDNAGNATTANFTLNWDVVAPNAPTVSGLTRTPVRQPTWSWSSGGGGNGTYKYQLENPDGTLESESAETSNTSWTPGSQLAVDNGSGSYSSGDNTYTLHVRERDPVGNWSAVGSHAIWIDPSYTAPPEISVGGPLYQSATSIDWSWSSGGGNGTYRWRINGGSWQPSDSGGTATTTTPDPYVVSTAVGSDETWTLEVQEQTTGGTWPTPDPKISSSTVRVDRQGPVAPTVSRVTASPTNDTTPTWSWNSNAGTDGTGNFRYKLNDSNLDVGATETTGTVFTASTLSDGPHTLYVQEQDSLGNWGSTGNVAIDVDTTAPTLTSLTLNGGDFSTNSTSVTVSIDAVSEPGMEMSILDYEPATAWEAWQPYDSSFTTDVPSGEGTKRVYVRLRDSVGNVSGYVTDSIVLDQTAPTSGSLILNQGDFYTPSLQARMGLTASDNYSSINDLEVQYRYWDGTGYQGTFGSDSWEPFESDMLTNDGGYTSSFAFTESPGYKYIYVRFRDEAGNVSGWESDYLYLQVPEPDYAWKGYYSNGATRVYFNAISEPSGSNTTRYYTYYSTDPNADPNDGDPVNYVGYTTSTEYDYVGGLPTGELLYFWTRAYNADSGGWGPYSSTNVLGFSSRVTVIYDDDDSNDVARAELIKEIIEDDADVDGTYSWVLGSWSGYSVTLLPEDDIPTTYNEGNKIYGDPIITTTGTYFGTTTGNSYDGRIRNIAASLRPVIGMSTSGRTFFYRVVQNFSSWGLSGTSPTALDSVAGLGSRATATTRPASTSSSIWYSPLTSDYLDNNQSTVFDTEIFLEDVYRYGIYLSGGVPPTDGQIFAGDPNYSTTYFPVVRQGRYAFYGFNEVPDTLNIFLFGLPPIPSTPARMGRLFWINLVYRMSLY